MASERRAPSQRGPAHGRPAARRASGRHYYFDEDGRVEPSPIEMRYVWPSELDLMARIAGMRLRDRWADWHGAPFTSASEQHVSVWEKAG